MHNSSSIAEVTQLDIWADRLYTPLFRYACKLQLGMISSYQS